MIDRIAAVYKVEEVLNRNHPEFDFHIIEVTEQPNEECDNSDNPKCRELINIHYRLKGELSGDCLFIQMWEDPNWWSNPNISKYADKVPEQIKNDPQALLVFKLMIYYYAKIIKN